MPRYESLVDHSRSHWTENGQPRPVRLTVWEPEREVPVDGPLPVVLLSHGTGGSVETLAWLAADLSADGYLVVGVDHHGNTAVEPYVAEGFAFVWERPRDLSFALDWALGEYRVDLERIAAVGFSLGGYTVAALAGARLNQAVTTLVLSGAIETPPLPEFPDLIERLAQTFPDATLRERIDSAPRDLRDSRVGRVAMLAPAIGPLVDEASLSSVRVPAMVVWGEADVIAPPRSGALMYANAIPGAVSHCLGDDVTHWSFLGSDESGVATRIETARLVKEFLSA